MRIHCRIKLGDFWLKLKCDRILTNHNNLWFSLIGILFFLIIITAQLFAEEFKRAHPGRVFSFPQDHFSHPEFKTEWWYYSGHLQSLDQKVVRLSAHLLQNRPEKRNKKPKIKMDDSKSLFCSSRFNG